jgi:hypothetical protein
MKFKVRKNPEYKLLTVCTVGEEFLKLNFRESFRENSEIKRHYNNYELKFCILLGIHK